VRTLATDSDGVIASTQAARAECVRAELGLDLDEYFPKQQRFIGMFGKDKGNRFYSEVLQRVNGSEGIHMQGGR
jgi:hypothetical protein